MQELSKIIDPNRVIFGDNIERKYIADDVLHKVGHAEALVFPISTDEVSKIMAFAYKNNLQVTPRGKGTNLPGAAVPLNGGIIIDLTRMNKIIEVDKTTFTATVESGVLLCDLSSAVNKEGLFYAPDPGEKTATIGGNISTNAGGMRAVKYGTTRDFVRGLEVVLSDGRVINVGSKNIKDSSGLSLKHLFIGSEGTLGVITKATLKLLPIPANNTTIVLGFQNLQEGVETINKIMLAGTDPVAIEFIQTEVIKLGEKYSKMQFPFPNSKAHMIVSYDGEAIDKRLAITQVIAKENNAEFASFKDEKQIADIWRLRSDLHYAICLLGQEEAETIDIVVPLNQIANFMKKVKELEKCGLWMYAFGHAGDGNIHLSVFPGTLTGDVLKLELEKTMLELYRYSIGELGGLVSGEHGIGICKQKYFLNNTSPDNLEIMNGIKKLLDPKGLLNVGKVYSKK
ncbi:MAG: FAD-binding oxidoreductase [Rickettsiales bacterium]|jgi:glycolate oxidase|nr:FAD-binding oxidoreductase [Rickettsiales bacterium]